MADVDEIIDENTAIYETGNGPMHRSDPGMRIDDIGKTGWTVCGLH